MAFSPGVMQPAEVHGKPKIFISHGLSDPIMPIDVTSRKFVAAAEEAGLRRDLPRVRRAPRGDAGGGARRVRVVPDVKQKKNKKEPAARPLLALAGMPLVSPPGALALEAADAGAAGGGGRNLRRRPRTLADQDRRRQYPAGKTLPPRLAAVVALFPQNAFATLNFALTAVLLIAVVGAIASYAEKVLTTSVAQWVAHDLRRMVYQRIQRLSLAEHGESRTGDLLTRVTSDIDAVQDFITSALLGIVINVLTLAGMLAVMFYMNWRFTLVGLSVAPPMFLLVYFYTKRIKKASRLVKKREGELLSGVAEKLTSIQVVQAFAREDYEDQRFDWESRQNVAAGLRARSVKARLSPMVDLLVAVGTCLVLGYGAHLVLTGTLSTGQLIIFLLYLGKTYKPMRDLSKMTNTVSKAAISFERIQDLLDMESRVRDMEIGGVAGAGGAAGADQGMGFVDEQDDRRRRALHLIDHRAQPLLEFALHRRARLHQADVERTEPDIRQRRRNLA